MKVSDAEQKEEERGKQIRVLEEERRR